MKNNFIILIIAVFTLSACSYSDEFVTVSNEAGFKIDYPSYMDETDDLTDRATLQYKNPYRNIYSIVRVEDKMDKTFNQFQQESIQVIKNFNLLNKTLVTDSFYTEKDNYKAIEIQLYGVMDNENIYYWHKAYETDKSFYEVVCWTRTMDRKQRYEADIEKILESFTPLK